MTPRFIPAARDEVIEAAAYYNSKQAGLGDEFKREVAVALDHIVDWPRTWSKVGKKARMRTTNRFPYGIVYLLDDNRNEIVNVAVMHLHRRPGYWRKRLKGLGP